MQVYPVGRSAVFIGLVLIMSLVSCSPKCVVRGRVVDAHTGQPIKGAAVAVRWYSEDPGKQPAKSGTFQAVQALSNDKGQFEIPEYPDMQHVLGVYKSGYICWSSRDTFYANPDEIRRSKYRERNKYNIQDGMEVSLTPLQRSHSRDLHAGFTVMVAGETTDSDTGPFHQAIQEEYRLWRENMRKDFEKQVGAK